MKQSISLHENISKQILTIGPDYHNHRGGIEAVIEIYSKYFEQFQFIPTYKVCSKLCNVFVFIGSVFKIFKRLVFDRNIRIVHIHGASYGSFYRKFICFIIVKYFFRKKVIYHVHGGGYHLFYSRSNKFNQKLVELFINNVDFLICLSGKWKSYYEQNFTSEKIGIISNIIDYPNENINIRKSPTLTFLFLSLICNNKGIFDLLHVISEEKEKYKGKLRLIIGGNGEIERLKNLIKDQQLEDLVEFVGWITNKEKDAWLQKANVYILPSYNEGLPISILEAMSYGQAIISTNVGGIPEIVVPDKNGILIDPGNLEQIKSSIDYFIDQPEKAKDYGKESKQMVKKHLPDSVMKELTSIYTSLLSNE
jgi:glycosyltransferase involved in cell wall biosynthesis